MSENANRYKKGKRCSSACLTQDHRTFGECMRAKSLQVSPQINDSYGTSQKAWDRELDNYESAVSQGVRPNGTKQAQVDQAMAISDATGVAFGGTS